MAKGRRRRHWGKPGEYYVRAEGKANRYEVTLTLHVKARRLPEAHDVAAAALENLKGITISSVDHGVRRRRIAWNPLLSRSAIKRQQKRRKAQLARLNKLEKATLKVHLTKHLGKVSRKKRSNG